MGSPGIRPGQTLRFRDRLLIGAPLIVVLLFVAWAVHAQSDATAPQNLTATVGDGGIALSWDAPTEAAASVTGYEVLRRRPFQGERSLLTHEADTGSAATAYTDTTATVPGERYVYRVKALRGVAKSGRSNFVRVDIPESEPTPTPEPTPDPAANPPAAPSLVRAPARDQKAEEPLVAAEAMAVRESCEGAGDAPTPVDVEVTAVPIVVASTTADYFVLYVRHNPDADPTVELPVSVTLGGAGTTTLGENVPPLPKEHYRVEKFLVDDPADVDGDCIDDITELRDPVE